MMKKVENDVDEVKEHNNNEKKHVKNDFIKLNYRIIKLNLLL